MKDIVNTIPKFDPMISAPTPPLIILKLPDFLTDAKLEGKYERIKDKSGDVQRSST